MRMNALLSLLLLALSACQGAVRSEPEPVAEATVYTTSAGGLRFAESRVPLMRPGTAAAYRVLLNGKSFQSVDGFGLAITQASCYNLLKMSPADRTAFLTEVFDRERGMGSSLIRVCIGGSDFSMDEFTWCDEPGLEHFAVHPLDEQYLFPVLDEIFAINPDVQIIASPWSAPLWMKVGEDGRTPHNQWFAGHLGEAYYQDYAKYFVRWIGNSGQQDYPVHIFEDPAAGRYVQGSAWHNYGGNVSVLDGVHARFPDKEIYFTEASIGTWNYSFEDCLINDFRDVFLGTLGRWGKGVTLWNLMLDYQGKPFRPRGCSTCYGAVSIDASDYSLGSIVRNSHYYDVAHCSKVLQPGAVRLGTSGYSAAGLTYQLYRNPDGSYAALILNETGSDALINFVTDNYAVACRIPPRAIQSVTWSE